MTHDTRHDTTHTTHNTQIVHETIATPAYDTAQEILDQAAACEADMIVMGSRGMGTIQGYTAYTHTHTHTHTRMD